MTDLRELTFAEIESLATIALISSNVSMENSTAVAAYSTRSEIHNVIKSFLPPMERL